MKTTPRPALARLGDVLQHHAGLLDAQRRGRLVEDEHAGPEVHRPGDGDALALAAGERADRLVDVLDEDAHLLQLGVGDLPHGLDVERRHRVPALADLRAEEEVAPHLHEAHDGEVLVDGRDARVERLARGGEPPLLAVDEQPALGVRVQARHDLDERGLAGAVVPEDAGDLPRVDRQVDALERQDRAVGLADVLHLHERLALVQVRGGVLRQGVRHVTSSARRSS
jgi:hypothetical protein